MGKYTKLNSRFGILEYPVILDEMESIVQEFPKTERTFYKYAFKELKKVLKKDEKIFSFNGADSKLTKTGFIVVAEHNLIFINLKFGVFGGADSEVIKYKDIASVDFDIIPVNVSYVESGILYLEIKKMFGSKKRTIRNISEHNLDNIVKAIRDRLKEVN